MFQKPLLLFNDFKIGFIYIIEDKKSSVIFSKNNFCKSLSVKVDYWNCTFICTNSFVLMNWYG